MTNRPCFTLPQEGIEEEFQDIEEESLKCLVINLIQDMCLLLPTGVTAVPHCRNA